MGDSKQGAESGGDREKIRLKSGLSFKIWAWGLPAPEGGTADGMESWWGS